MSPALAHKIRVGIPYRTRKEELSNKREAYEKYIAAVESNGAEPVEISLGLSPAELQHLARTLDAVLLPGSPRTSNLRSSTPRAIRKPPSPTLIASAPIFALLDHAVTEHKPVLAICYGVQSLNVFLGGPLVQDIPSAIHTKIQHAWTGHEGPEPHHDVTLDAGSRLGATGGRKPGAREQLASPVRASAGKKSSRRGSRAGWRDRSSRMDRRRQLDRRRAVASRTHGRGGRTVAVAVSRTSRGSRRAQNAGAFVAAQRDAAPQRLPVHARFQILRV